MIRDHLALFDVEGEEFKALVFDPDKTENDPVENINDINQGTLHNALTWHSRHGERYSKEEEMNLQNARGEILQMWGDFFNIPRPSGFDDAGYAQFLINTILAVQVTDPTIFAIFDTEDVLYAHELGPYLDHSYLDIAGKRSDIVEPVAGFSLTHTSNALYVIFDSVGVFDPSKMRAAANAKAAGVGIFAGIHTP